MSGHSHWATIKHKKGATDAKRSQTFSKLTRIITVAAREGGGNPETNPKLRMAIDKAKGINMPSDNIERAIKKGVGGAEGEKLEELLLEAFGPAKIAIMIECVTDNKNRALLEIKQILNQHGGKMANEGSVRWLFEKRGVISIGIASNSKTKEDLELTAIEAGAEDLYWGDDLLEVYIKPDGVENAKKSLEDRGVKIDGASLGWVAKELVAAEEREKQELEKLFESLDENDAVQEIYSNLKT